MATTSAREEPPAAGDVKTSTARCHCGSIHYQVTLPTTQLPISSYMCHCSACRHTFGAMCVAHANLPSGVRPQFIAPSSLEGSATKYQAPGSIYETFFCATCGSHVGGYCARTDTWIPSTALFLSDAFTLRAHYFTRSAPRGLHEWLPRVGDRELDVINPDVQSSGDGNDDGTQVIDPSVPPCMFSSSAAPPAEAAATGPDSGSSSSSSTETTAAGEERLLAQCHCGGVSFTIPRPPADVLAHPFLRQFASPATPATRWKAVVDACNDCRLAGGVPVSAWAFVPRRLLSPAVGRDLGLGTLRAHESSPRRWRTFCGVCGATVLFWGQRRLAEGEADDADADVVDIEVGILRAPEGVAAEDWLTWRTGTVIWLAAGCEYDAEFYESLSKGHRAWGERSHGSAGDY
jgi:hypothetical protein